MAAYDIFAEGERVRDFYSGALATVTEGRLSFDTPYPILLLERP
jgi:alpha-amylase